MKRPITIIVSLLILAVTTLLQAGCGANEPVQLLAVQKEQNLQMQALVSGRLVLDDGYLRVRTLWPLRGILIIWPYGYSWKAEDSEIWIINEEGRAVARVGDKIQIGGGEIPASFAEEKIGQPLPADIEGPFWLAGEVKEE